MIKDELSVLKMDFIKLIMLNNHDYIKHMTLLQILKNTWDIKKRLIDKVKEIFDIGYDNIYKIDEISSYDFFVELYDFLKQIRIEEMKVSTDIVPIVRIYQSLKSIEIYYSEFYEYHVGIHINGFISVRLNMFGVEESVQFCRDAQLSLENKVLILNIMRSLYDFLMEYIEYMCQSNMEIISTYREIHKLNKNKPDLQHLFRKQQNGDL